MDIIIECESLVKGVSILRGKHNDTYIMATMDDAITVPEHQVLGAFGAGTMRTLSPDNLHTLPWSLPQGNQTVVSYRQVSRWYTGELISKINQVLWMMERERSSGQSDLDIVGLGRASRTWTLDSDSGHWPKYTWTQTSSTCPLGFVLRETQQEPRDSSNCFTTGTTRDLYAG